MLDCKSLSAETSQNHRRTPQAHARNRARAPAIERCVRQHRSTRADDRRVDRTRGRRQAPTRWVYYYAPHAHTTRPLRKKLRRTGQLRFALYVGTAAVLSARAMDAVAVWFAEPK